MPFFNREKMRQVVVEEIKLRSSKNAWIIAGVSVSVLVLVFYTAYIRAPGNFPTRTILTVQKDAGLNEISNDLERQHIVRSAFWFRMAVLLTSGDKSVMAGDYFFKNKAGVFAVASRLTRGVFGVTPVKITLPEGLTVKQMGVILRAELLNFDATEFEKLAKGKEGYLFPDTYLFPPNAKPSDVITVLENNFRKQIAGIDAQIKSFKKSEKEVVNMASILEAEARTTETRQTIAGILWKRLALGMPLQVDAPFQYSIGKNTFQLTLNDLKIDSPYNTYKYKGLPPTPINNPGLDALISAVTPVKSEYLFYLSDVRGGMHYAKTFAEHILNKEKYLK